MVGRDAVAAAVAGLDRTELERARWFAGKGRTIERLELDEGFVLGSDPSHVLAIATAVLDGGERQRYQLPLTGDMLRPAVPGDGTWRALVAAMADGRVIAALPAAPDAPARAALVCRPGPAMVPGVATAVERDLGADQSNTSVVLDEAVLLKAYRRLQPGLNPDLEMTAFLSEEAGFTAVPPLAGYVELVETSGTTTVAMAQRFIADGADGYEAVAEALTAWLLAPGTVSLEVSTEIAADLGALTAGLHAALADGHGLPDMAPRPATRDELRAWSRDARANLERAVEVAPTGDAAATLHDLAPRIAEALTILAALPTTPEVIRAHGDYHLGQVLIAGDGYRIIDFEGEPLGTPDERRAHRHPLRDVASMLRSVDHVAGSAARRAAEANGGAPVAEPGLDLPGWRRRARERFLEAYRTGLSEARVWVDQDPALLLAFEVDKELYEFAYAATYLPSWLWAPTEGIRDLLAGDS